MKTDLTENPFAPPYVWQQVYEGEATVRYYVLGGLTPYSEHTVKTEACNAVGCVNSTASTGRTNQDSKSEVWRLFLFFFGYIMATVLVNI